MSSERASQGGERATRKEGGPRPDGSGSEKKDFSLVESLVNLIKLNVLKEKLDFESLGEEKLVELEESFKKGGKDKKKEAARELDELFKKTAKLKESVRKESGLEDVVSGVRGAKEKDKETAKDLDKAIESLKEKSEERELEEEQVVATMNSLCEFAEGLGVEVERKEDFRERLSEDFVELQKIMDRTKLLQHKEEVKKMGLEEEEVNESLKKKILEKEDFQDEPEEEKRVFKVRKGRKGKAEEKQGEVDELVQNVKKDIEEKRIDDLREKLLLKRMVGARELARDMFSFGEDLEKAEEAYDLALDMYSLYAGELTERLSKEEIKKIEVDEKFKADLEGIVSSIVRAKMDEVWSSSKKGRENEAVEAAREEVGGFSEAVGYLRGEEKMQQEAEILREEIDDYFKSMQKRGAGFLPRTDAEGNLKREGIVKELGELREANDYEGYVKRLIAYLFKVGLREGMNDYRLTMLMNDARDELKGWGIDDAYIELFEGFEKLAMFHEKFGTIASAEELHKLLTHIGIEPFKVWLGNEGDKLGVEVEIGEKKESLSVWKFNDMMQTEEWAQKLLYTSASDERSMYDQMLLNRLFGKGEYKLSQDGGLWKRRMRKGEWMKMETNLNDEVLVDGKEVALGKLIRDSRWVAGLAHDVWKYSGRWANVVDNVQISKAKVNKNLLAIYRIRRYCEEYGITPTYFHKVLGLDAFIYSFENYKRLISKGLSKQFIKAGYEHPYKTDNDGDPVATKEAGDVASLIDEKIKRIRTIDKVEFRTNYIALEDVKLLLVKKEDWAVENGGHERAKEVFIERQEARGKSLEGHNLDSEFLENGMKNPYYVQIEAMRKRYKKAAFSEKDWAKIDKLDWAKINRVYEEKLSLEKGYLGDDFDGFMNNFSFSRLNDYESLRNTDLENFGKYFELATEVTAKDKALLNGGSITSVVDTLSLMIGYQPYASSKYKEYADVLLRHVSKLKKRKLADVFVCEPMNDDGALVGQKMDNGEYLVDENGFWVSQAEFNEDVEKKKINLVGQSVLLKERYIKASGMVDIEYAMRYAVNKGVIERADAEKTLKKMFGNKALRLLRRALWLNDPWYLWDAAIEEGGKSIEALVKHVFSG